MRSVFACAAVVIGILAGCSGEGGIGSSESEVGTPPPRAWTPAAVKPGNLRIATYNIRNFPKDVMGAADADAGADGGAAPEDLVEEGLVRRSMETDLAMAVTILDTLDFDVLAVQEINDTAAFEDLLARLGAKNGRRYQAVFSTEWPHPQHTGIVVRSDRLRIESPKVHGEIATRPTMRAGLSARIVSKKDHGADFGMLVLHLASGDSAGRARLRAEQASFAAKVVAERRAEMGDDDFVVVGDFNTARKDEELPGFDAAMGSAESGLARQAHESTCSTYHTKGKNPVLEPSWIDHVYLASFAERDTSVPIVSGTHCAERSCQPFESSSAESGTSYWGVSDHCPVYFEVADEDLD